MKPGAHFSLILAAALAAAPALAQHSVSGTIASKGTPAHASSASAPSPAEVAASAAATAPAPAPVSAAAPAAQGGAAATAATADGVTAPATAAVAPGSPPPPSLTMAIPTPPPSSSSAGGGLLQTTFALMFVLVLLLGLAWFLKRFGPKNFGGGGNTVRLVGALSVGTRERILVVEVGEQWIVVGASPGRMNALATMPRQQQSADDIAAGPAMAPLAGANFAAWFKQTIDKRNGK